MTFNITINGTFTVRHEFPQPLKVSVTEPAEEAALAARLAEGRKDLADAVHKASTPEISNQPPSHKA